jgi:hypothetical protein
MGTLSDQEAAQFETHTLVCESCLRAIELADAFSPAIRSAARKLRDSRHS